MPNQSLRDLPRSRSGLLIAFLLLFFSRALPGQVQILTFDRVVDGTGKMLEARELAVEGSRILALGDNLLQRYPSAIRIDLKQYTAIPGLIDVHTHMTYGLLGPSQGNAWREMRPLTDSDQLVVSARNAQRTLETGVTSVRDLNAGGNLDFHLRELISSGALVGPRMFIAGRGIHPGSLPERPGSQPRNLRAEAIAAAASRVADGVDWVKFFGTSGSADDLTSRLSFPEDVLIAAIRTAKELGGRVTVHSYGPEAVAAAVQAGADSIEHATGVSDELLRQMADRGVVYVPTVDHNRYYADHGAEFGYDANTQKSLYEFVERNRETLQRALRAGVTVAMGSDAVFTGFGENTWELRQFVRAGMTPAQALEAATVHGANLLGQSENLGRLAPGYLADIVALSANPLESVEAIIGGVVWVMKEGKVVVDKRSKH